MTEKEPRKADYSKVPEFVENRLKEQGKTARGDDRMWMISKEKQVEISKRREAVATNLLAGMTYRQIAKALDIAVGTVAGDVRWILDEYHNERVLAIGDFVNLELSRLDRALYAIWGDVISGKLPAIDRFLKISERRSKLLGLDKPEFAPDWKQTIVVLLQRGDVEPDRVISDFGNQVAQELFSLAGVNMIDAESTDVESD